MRQTCDNEQAELSSHNALPTCSFTTASFVTANDVNVRAHADPLHAEVRGRRRCDFLTWLHFFDLLMLGPAAPESPSCTSLGKLSPIDPIILPPGPGIPD